jgi:hypothetical protein
LLEWGTSKMIQLNAFEFSKLDKIRIGRKEAAFIGGLFHASFRGDK